MSSASIMADARKHVAGWWDILMDRVKIHEAYQQVFTGTPEGEKVLEHILKRGFAFDTTFVRGDVNETLIREGMRRMALSIARHAIRDHKKFQQMIEQQYRDLTTNDDNAS